MTPIFATVDPYILAFSFVTVAATVFMGFWSAKKSKTAGDFFVAGRSVSVGWNASAISGEYLSAASFMGIAGMVMSSGYDALWYPVCYACGYLFLLLFIAGPLRRFGAYTIPDFAEGRYDSPVFRKIAVVFVLFIGFFYTMPQMKGAGTTLAYIFPGLPYWVGVALVGAIITLNVALGGMKGITLVQAVQYWAKMFAISVPIFVLMAVYGNYGKQIHGNSTKHNLPTIEALSATNSSFGQNNTFYLVDGVARSVLPEKAPADSAWLSPFGPLTTKAAKATAAAMTNSPSGIPLARSHSASHEFVLNHAVTNVSQMLTVFGELTGREFVAGTDPYILSEVKLSDRLTADPISGIYHPSMSRTEEEVRQHIEACLRDAGVTLVPVDNTKFSAVETEHLASYWKDARKAWMDKVGKPLSLLYTYSLIIALVCGTAGLPHILVRFYTNPDGVAAKRTTMWVMILIGIFYVFPPVFGVMGRNLFPELYNGIGAKGTDKIVLELPRLLNEKYAPLGSILSGITCAGAFAAFMSTFSGLLVSMTGALAHDVYGRMLRPKSTPEQRMRMFKFAAVFLGGIAILLGSFVEPLEINFMVGQAFAIAAASYFPLLFMSVWWRGMTMRGAAVGMLIGGLCALVAATLTNVSNLALDKGPMGKIFAGFAPMNAYWSHHPLLRILCEQPAIWTVPLAITLMIVVSKATRKDVPSDVRMKMLVLHAPEKLGLKQEYIQEHQGGH
jgi:Na+(H+)/acetate symporter ActP